MLPVVVALLVGLAAAAVALVVLVALVVVAPVGVAVQQVGFVSALLVEPLVLVERR